MIFLLLSDTPAMIEKASTYGVDDVVEFLCSIGLGDRYTTSFTEEEITGDFLLEADHETLDELGVDSQDQQEILSQFWNRMEEETKYVWLSSHFMTLRGWMKEAAMKHNTHDCANGIQLGC